MAPLRAELRARRRSISAAEQAKRGRAVADRVVRMHQWDSARVVAAYVAHDGELDPTDLVQRALLDDKVVVSPAIVGEHMEFRLAVDLRVASFGIMAPPEDAPVFSPAAIDFVINPLVGFDRSGARIGRGRGYYDRTFADPATRPFLCGVAHPEQEVDHLERNDWDVALSVIVTPTETIWPRAESVI